MSSFVITVGVIFLIAYFLPTLVAMLRGAHNWGWTFVLNLLFGLTGIGYFMAWVWAMGPTKAELQAQAERQRLSEESDRAIITMERRSREQLEYRS